MKRRPRRALRILGFIFLLVIVVPVVLYHTLDPCEMLKREYIKRAQQAVEAVTEEASSVEADEVNLEKVREVIDQTLDEVSAGVAAIAAELQTDAMSLPRCVEELLELKF